LRKELKLKSASKDREGIWFCLFWEETINLIYISQFHSEKQTYKWIPTVIINHHYETIEALQYIINQFVEHSQTYFSDLKFKKNKDLKNPKHKKSKNELSSAARCIKKLVEEDNI
jgi:hypothetical protein